MSTLRPFLAVAALAALLLAACTTGETADTEPPTEAEESEAATEEAAEVFIRTIDSLEGPSEPYSTQRPESAIVQENFFAYELEWLTWGPETAVATGRVNGMWCWDACEKGFEAIVVLCDVIDDHFSRFSVFGDFTADYPETTFESPLYIDGFHPYSEENWYGCEEPEPTMLA
ncbi:hypothetical protein [Glycomyces sp. NRRL B-16210]|uniref:hypothetical protein n=1 Tax=Glycomyces sp. NRRL B-16210 TaxID=1463821 RepID=UPI0004C270F6|nr:hypothetical protein [Glycomyces sp. NRRL B-16210]